MPATNELAVADVPRIQEAAHRNVLALLALGTCALAFWMLQHPYEGIIHDSVLYSFSALARLHPESLGHDIFLASGSQDRYTLFSPIAAAIMRVIGLEPGAALITLVSHLAFFICGWLLARRFCTSTTAAVAAALLVALPGIYGAQYLFSYSESFMTPRLPAEALVLASLAAAGFGRYGLSAVCLLGAALLHPLMAAPGIFLLFVWLVGLPRPKLALGVIVAGFAVLVAVAFLAPVEPIARFDPDWFEMLHSRISYLFPSLWSRADWGHASVPLGTLVVGWLTLTGAHARQLCIAALITGLSGIALSLVGGDWLRLEIVVQIQPWRWLWLSNALAVILIPGIVGSCWPAGLVGRATVMLLAAAWIGIDERFVPFVVLLTIAAAAARRTPMEPGRARLVFYAAVGVLALVALLFASALVATSRELAHIAPNTALYHSNYLLLLRKLRPWASGGVLPACLLLLTWLSLERWQSHLRAEVVLSAAVVLCAAFFPLSWSAWTRVTYTEAALASFANWRSIIPPESQVFWESTHVAPWYVLQRPSYWSLPQMAEIVFSRKYAVEITRREKALTHVSPQLAPLQQLSETCATNPGMDFFVTPRRDFGHSPFAPVVLDPNAPDGRLSLYRCSDFQSKPGA